jgi:hypothetical protein
MLVKMMAMAFLLLAMCFVALKNKSGNFIFFTLAAFAPAFFYFA